MTTHELYINDILCDLSEDEVVTLLYQSPIFSGLDSIQSNRSYNIALPLTPTNMRAVGYAARPDAKSDAPYIRLRAALYQNGVPLFTHGLAVVTDVSETINVTLTWGNVDNFQPLFDANLRDLGVSLDEDHVNWNQDTSIVEANTQGTYPNVGFWGINFGMGLSNPKYLHPSVPVEVVVSAIERYNGITIEGKSRLYESKNIGLIVPLVSKNGSGLSNYADASICPMSFNNNNSLRYNFSSNKHDIKTQVIQNTHFASTSGLKNKLYIDSGGKIFGLATNRIPPPTSIWLYITLYKKKAGDFYLRRRIKIASSVKDGNKYIFDPISVYYDLDADDWDYFAIESSFPVTSASETAILRFWSEWDECIFPTIFPVARNLPDMSQGDFILGLMSMNGLFAYADKNSPDTIKLISIEDIADNARKDDVIDWSDRVILNDMNRVDMPDASTFNIDDFAQKNILDYDNDDDVKTDTYGIISIRNKTIEKESELVQLPFSASENRYAGDVECAFVPIYEDDGKGGATYSKCSPRILSIRGAFMSGILRYIGAFDPWMRFGGDNGLVKMKYAAYQNAVDRLRIISVRAKLSAVDLYNLDYSKPVYIAQFGHIFAIYSVETGEDGVCDCQLLQLDVSREGITGITIASTPMQNKQANVTLSILEDGLSATIPVLFDDAFSAVLSASDVKKALKIPGALSDYAGKTLSVAIDAESLSGETKIPKQGAMTIFVALKVPIS